MIKFDLTSLPKNVASAQIYLYCYPSGSGSSGNVALNLDRIETLWDETTNWSSKPAFTNISQFSAPTPNTWIIINITELYNDWQSGLFSNYGVQLRPTETNNRWNNIYSSDYMDDPSLRPKLVIIP
ncbi:DNRLRE domain-containing protein [Deltaproteobacteria bacterium TL4]